MIIVIIAGGSGTRLWPLSTPDYPKHLLQIDASGTSLLQATYQRAKSLTDNIYVVSDNSHIEHVRQQLPDLEDKTFIVEPDRRGTANCILAALLRISEQLPSDEPLAFIHADHYIRDTAGFANSLKLAAKTSQTNNCLVLVGVEPDHPATGFGYIQKGELLDPDLLIYKVESFKEKPDLKTAQEYLASGSYLWNCGYFVGSVNTFEAAMKQYAPELLSSYTKLKTSSADDFNSTYMALPTEAIDYALIEKVDNLLVVPASFDWMDLGSYTDLHKAVGGDEDGNHVHGQVEMESVTNSYINNKEDKPVAVIGLDDVAIVNTPKGLLITRKDLSQKVGDISKRFSKPQ